jgi:hypothetical protein
MRKKEIEISDGCAGSLVMALIVLLTFATVVLNAQPANFATKTVKIQPANGELSIINVEMFVEQRVDTLSISLKTKNDWLIQTGVAWVGSGNIWTAVGPGFVFEYSENVQGKVLKLNLPAFWVFELYSYTPKF